MSRHDDVANVSTSKYLYALHISIEFSSSPQRTAGEISWSPDKKNEITSESEDERKKQERYICIGYMLRISRPKTGRVSLAQKYV
jgi:hypothetical protein